MKALLYGINADLLDAIPALLTRAGFDVDVISTQEQLRKHIYIAHFIKAKSLADLIALVRDYSKLQYDLVLPCDDLVIKTIVSSPFSLHEKSLVLPVVHSAYFSHLASKIGLSFLLEKNKIKTPAFVVAHSSGDLESGASKTGFPLFVKVDFSSGGEGVYECQSRADFKPLQAIVYPVLMQKKIEGKLITTGALFLNQRLIYFDIAQSIVCRPEKVGVSVVRKYRKPTIADKGAFEKVKALGEAIGANGFVNLTWIESEVDGEIYFIEADMRPNVWIEYAKHFQEDPAKKIKRYYETGETLTIETFVGDDFDDVVLAYAPRMRFYEVLFNKYNCISHYSNYYNRPLLLRKTRLKIQKLIRTQKQFIRKILKPSAINSNHLPRD